MSPRNIRPESAEEPDGNAKELLRGNTDSLLLFLIAESSHIHGYHLIKEIERRSRGYFQFREGTVYPALHKLEKDGLIQGEWGSQSGRQQRRYYRITPKGREALSSRLRSWRQFATAMELILQAPGA
jgi:DNA-binding PadR family transcriptional regulator